MSSGQFFGIDFGTTNTAVVRIQEESFARQVTILGEEGLYPFSSIVAIPKEGGNCLFGREVRRRRLELSATHEIYTSMKPFLGRKEADGTPFSLLVGGERYYPKDIVVAFFRHIQEQLRQAPGVDITAASFTYPCNFTPAARGELLAAAAEAGIKVEAFLSEPSAAYLANYHLGKAYSRVMVLDWGGGTLDISILQLTGSSLQEIEVEGESFGGDDIDLEIAQRLHARIVKASGVVGAAFHDMDLKDRDALIAGSEAGKIELAHTDEYPLRVRNYGMYGNQFVYLSSQELDSMVEPLLRDRVLKTIAGAMEKAGLTSPESIDCLIITGGSSNLRCYERAITELFAHCQIIVPSHVQWSTATGAALMQIMGSKIRLNDTISLLLSDGSYFPVLPQGMAVGEATPPYTFSLMEDALDAHFIFSNQNGDLYQRVAVPTKGFLRENLVLQGSIDEDQVARFQIRNHSFGSDPLAVTQVALHRLPFYYDISVLQEKMWK
ncbi:MAG: Hsp70 family protein [Symbiobacteriaceae bacterium]|nr:Hsp70 family protein [Symbiobacteriaceae bacterium]